MSGIRITVLKVTFNADLAKTHCRDWMKPCPVFAENQTFLLDDPWTMPAGFCSTAWGDIFKNVQTIGLGGSFPSALDPGTNVACCTDGIRPVIFKIERLEDGTA